MDQSQTPAHPNSVIPTPRQIDPSEGAVAIPPMLPILGSNLAIDAVRPFLRILEDCGALQMIFPVNAERADGQDEFLRLHLITDDHAREGVENGEQADERADSSSNAKAEDAWRTDQSYELKISEDGIELTGSLSGLRLGAQTLISLLPPACLMPGSGVQASLQCCRIVDSPAYAWRGLMIDTVRHFMPLTWLRRVVQIAAFHKLNVLRLHLTDDQGWRMPIDAFPRLTTIGARRRETVVMPYPTEERDGVPHGGFYTKPELRALVAYASQFGITVVPEVDLPGHMIAAIAAYPEWGNSSEPLEVRTTWGISEDVINTRPQTIAALKTILDEVMDVFPSPYIHIGGDEAPTRDWEQSDEVAALMEREGIPSVRAVQGWIMDDLVDHVHSRGRTVIAWDEAMDAGISRKSVIQGWRSAEKVDEALARGYETIASPQQHYYLDYQHSLDPSEPGGIGGWRNQFIDMDRLYSYQVPGKVMGVEAALWAEFVKTPERASFQLLPRLAGVAEKAWRANQVPAAEFMQALKTQELRYQALGWEHRPLNGPGIRWSVAWDQQG